MDAGLLWTAIGSLAGVLGVVLVAWQVRFQLRERHAAIVRGRSSDAGHFPDALSVTVPLGRLPAEIRGRDSLVSELRHLLTPRLSLKRLMVRHQTRPGRTWVLAGMGGLGKSTVALATARAARAKGWRVWWVTATDTASLTGGMLEILRQLGAPDTVTEPVREGAPAAAERAWEFLNGATHAAGRRWLLIFDNADIPSVLGAAGAASPADHAGWLRPDPSGVVLVTTRNKDPRTWGPGIVFCELAPLDDQAAGKILTDLAPAVPDPGSEQAQALGRRLGGLPLALHLAGSYLASPFARWHTFAEYRHALDSVELPAALADLDEQAADPRATIQRTWDLSLDGLAAIGRPQARSLLFLLSCYAPAIPIPVGLIQPQPLSGLLTPDRQHGSYDHAGTQDGLERLLRSCLRDLATAGLLDISGSHGQPVVTIHPVVADANRARLRTTAQSSLPAVSEAAVKLVVAAATGLDCERPADWPAWQRLAPHVLALPAWLAADLPAATLAHLLDAINLAAAALVYSGRPAAAEKLARAAVDAGRHLDADNPACLQSRRRLAAALDGRGLNKEAEQLYRDLLPDQQRVLGYDHPDTLATRFELARVIGHARFAEAEQLYRDILGDQERVLGDNHPDTLRTRYSLAWSLGRQGRGREAEPLYRQVLEQRLQILGKDYPDTLSARHGLAWSRSWQGHYREAEQQYQRLLADQHKILDGDHPYVLSTRHDLAWSIAMQGRHSQAEKLYRQVLPDQQRVRGDGHPTTLYTRMNLATAIANQRRHAEAEQMYRQLIIDEKNAIGDEHPVTAETLCGLATVIASQGRDGEAERLYRQALASGQPVLGDHHPVSLRTSHMLARVIASQHRYAEAEQLLRFVLTQRERYLGSEHPDTQAAQQDLEQLTRLQVQAESK